MLVLQTTSAPSNLPTVIPPRRRRLPTERLDLIAACHRVLAETTDPEKRTAIEAITFHLLRSRQKVVAAK